MCFQRSQNESVPGCSPYDEYGEMVATDGLDYCIEPRQPVLLDTKWGSDLGVCEGDCDSDDDCRGELKCYQRDYRERVTGCDGSGRTGWDYCYNPLAPTSSSSANRLGDEHTNERQKFKTFSFYVMGDAPPMLCQQ